MKKINTIIILFLVNVNLFSQTSCLPETREDDVTINTQAAKCLNYYCQDSKITYARGINGAKEIKGEYLRHTFLTQWKDATYASDGQAYRYAFVAVGIKTAKGCMVVVIYIHQTSLGAGKFGTMQAETYLQYNDATKNFSSYEKYIIKEADCDCINKEKNWLTK